MTRVLSTDLDGTLVFPDGVHADDARALRRWIDEGNVLVVNTGRSIGSIRRVWVDDALPAPHAFIGFTGAVVADPSLRVMRSQPLPRELLGDVMELLAGVDATVFASQIEQDYLLRRSRDVAEGAIPVFWEPGEAEALRATDLFGIPVHVPDPDDRARVIAGLEGLCDGRAEVHLNLDYIDIVPAGATKGTGLRQVLADLGDHSPVWTIGDSWNDLAMHEVADHPVAMAAAPREVSCRCERVVSSVAELVDLVLG